MGVDEWEDLSFGRILGISAVFAHEGSFYFLNHHHVLLDVVDRFLYLLAILSIICAAQ